MKIKGLFRHFTFGFLLLTLIFLNGCSTVKQDGPPPYDVDVSKIPDAVPKVEHLSRLGNKPSYHVFGKQYYVMKSSKNYEEQGIASWYGTRFHQHHTTNGERYDMLSMTAAHKSLPLPTYLLVTNLENGKKVIVRVNDRGPFVGNRLIDLSYVAAKKLGMLAKGTAQVDIKAINPMRYDINNHRTTLLAKNNKHPMYKTLSHPAIYLQVGAFKNKLYAERLRRQLIRHGSYSVSLTYSKSLYRVKIGPIHDVATAAKINRQLKAMGLNSRKLLA